MIDASIRTPCSPFNTGERGLLAKRLLFIGNKSLSLDRDGLNVNLMRLSAVRCLAPPFPARPTASSYLLPLWCPDFSTTLRFPCHLAKSLERGRRPVKLEFHRSDRWFGTRFCKIRWALTLVERKVESCCIGTWGGLFTFLDLEAVGSRVGRIDWDLSDRNCIGLLGLWSFG